MKKVIKGAEPQLLATYKVATPQNSWEQYTKKKNRKVLVQDRLKSDQSGLCAYCEINLLEKDSAGDADFRVEHFHPKSDTSTAHNWHLDWQNLLGCCHGGSQSNVTSSTIRFTSPDHSCDVPKEDKNLDGIILNPLTDVPAYPSIFKCDRTSGKLTAHSENCISANISDAIVQQTIDELRLDAERLNRFRREVLNKLNLELQSLTQSGLTLPQAQSRLSQIYLRKDGNQHWPAFFTSIRSYLGTKAEEHLRTINYAG